MLTVDQITQPLEPDLPSSNPVKEVIALQSPLSALRALRSRDQLWFAPHGTYALMRCGGNPYGGTVRACGDLVSVCYFAPARSHGTMSFWDKQEEQMTIPGEPVLCNGKAVMTGSREVQPEVLASLVAWAHSAGLGRDVAQSDRIARLMQASHEAEATVAHSEDSDGVTLLLAAVALTQGGHPSDYALFLQECAIADTENGTVRGVARLEELTLGGRQVAPIAAMEACLSAIAVDGQQAIARSYDECASGLSLGQEVPGGSRGVLVASVAAAYSDLSVKQQAYLDRSSGGIPLNALKDSIREELVKRGCTARSLAESESMIGDLAYQLASVHDRVRRTVTHEGSPDACVGLSDTDRRSGSAMVMLTSRIYNESVLNGSNPLLVLRSRAGQYGLVQSNAAQARQGREEERRSSLNGEVARVTR